MKLLQWFCLTAACCLFAGCVTRDIHPASVDSESRIDRNDVIAVRLTPESASRVEPADNDGSEMVHYDKVYTGEVIHQVFLGYRDDQPTFEITESHLSHRAIAAGLSMRWTYSLSGILRVNGQAVEVNSVGSRAAAVNLKESMRQAIELAAVDAAHQCRRIIEANAPKR